MYVLLTPKTQILAMDERAGGLFHFNATLPFMSIHFILLTVVLTFIFYKPTAKVIDERKMFLTSTVSRASSILTYANILQNEFDEKVKQARVFKQAIISASEREAKESVNAETSQARKNTEKLIERTRKDLEEQKNRVLPQLEQEVNEIAALIKDKVEGITIII